MWYPLHAQGETGEFADTDRTFHLFAQPREKRAWQAVLDDRCSYIPNVLPHATAPIAYQRPGAIHSLIESGQIASTELLVAPYGGTVVQAGFQLQRKWISQQVSDRTLRFANNDVP